MAHYSIFRQELANAYPTYGNALWEPDPGGQYNAVEVGDVGFIRRGYFQRLFNVLLPKDHSSHTFVPEDHQQLETILNHIVKNEIRTGSRQNSLHFCSQYVTLDSRGRGTAASGPEDDSQITFSCNGRQGALLSLPAPAQGQDTVAFGDFGKWMIKHIDTWFAFARGLGLGINRMEDIILVTGRHLTKSWVNVAFTQRRPDAGVSFDAQVSRHSRHSHVFLEQDYVRGGDLKLGPTGMDLPENQCIFIRGFRVARILGMWPKLRGQAGPAPNAGDQEPEPESDPQREPISVPDDSNDPLHDLLHYVAEQAPDCDMALVHDNDLTCMDVAPFGRINSWNTMGHFWNSAPTVQQFQCELLSGNKSGPGADVAVVKVATLSEHAFEAPLKGSDFNPVLTAGGATDRSAPVASLPVTSSVSTSSRLDRATFDAEQERIEAEIGLLHEMLVAVNDKISNMTLVDKSFVDFSAIRAQIEDLQPQHRSNMTSRNEIRNQITTLRRGIQNKERTLQVSGENEEFKTVEDVGAHIRNPEVRVRSGVMRDTEERRTLREIDDTKRIREVADQALSDAAIKAIGRRHHPGANAISEGYYPPVAETIVKEEKVDLIENPSLLFDRQRELQRQINTLFSERYDLISRLREDDTRYYAMLNDSEDRYQRAEWRSADREVNVPVGGKVTTRALTLPVQIEDQIDDCQMLIEYFSGMMSTTATVSFEPRDHSVSTKDRSEFKKGPKAHSTAVTGEISSSSSIDLPFSTRLALGSLSIVPPSSPPDLPRVVENLKTRKAQLEERAVTQNVQSRRGRGVMIPTHDFPGTDTQS